MNPSPFTTPTGTKVAGMLALFPAGSAVALLAFGRLTRFRSRAVFAASAFGHTPAERDAIVEAERRMLLSELGQLHGEYVAAKGGVN